jgi:eukaryotic-like serine/threonine-protein kinase
MSDDLLKPGGALSGRLFGGFLERLSENREPGLGDRVGPYRILSELGRGGSGVVFLAERVDGAFTQQVALKWLRGDRPVPGGRGVLERERELLASLDHPHIARLIDGGESDDGQLWFAMDYVAGDSIDVHAATLGLKERLDLVRAVCRAVHHAHSRGLIHGDIKPANVRVDERGQPRLLDFGIARLEDAAGGGSYGLTPEYASPEQRRGDDLTTVSDVWQLGRLLDQLLVDQDVPADLQAVADRAMADDPDRRYNSAAAMALDLDAWQKGLSVAAYGGGPAYRMRRFAGRHRAATLIGGLSLTIMLVGGAWLTWQLAEQRDQARYQAERATTALHESEVALARAERLHDFLIGLFQASRPDRPRDQLPSTAEILERGASQALNPEITPAGERFGMLSAIGQVYRAQSRYELARPLIEEALRLAHQDHDWLRPQDRAGALASMADLMVRAGDDLDQAETMLIEAEVILSPGNLDQLVPIRITRTWIERHRGQHAQALALLEPLARRLHDGEPVSVNRRAALLDAMAGLQAATGNLEQAAQTRTLAIEAARQAHGEEGQAHVVSLANSVGLEMAIGNFAEAERRARQAIELYDRIYPEPVDFRAAVRDTLSRLLLTTGNVDQAFAQQALAGAEQAESLGVALERWPLYFSRRATFHARLGQLEPALEDMHRAHELLHEHGDLGPRLADTMDMLLAWVLCLDGEGTVGANLLDGLDSSESLMGNPRNRSHWHEAQAACSHALGRHDDALAAIDKALELTASQGQVLTRVDRQLLKARILTAKDQQTQARALLQKVRDELLALGFATHPVLERLDH